MTTYARLQWSRPSNGADSTRLRRNDPELVLLLQWSRPSNGADSPNCYAGAFCAMAASMEPPLERGG